MQRYIKKNIIFLNLDNLKKDFIDLSLDTLSKNDIYTIINSIKQNDFLKLIFDYLKYYMCKNNFYIFKKNK